MRTSKEMKDIVEKARTSMAQKPVKEAAIQWGLVAELLEPDFRKMKAKGYNALETTEMLRADGVPIPAYLVKKHWTGRKPSPQQTVEHMPGSGYAPEKILTDKPKDMKKRKKAHKADDELAQAIPQPILDAGTGEEQAGTTHDTE